MTAKQWLNRARRLDEEITRLEETKCRERERLMNMTPSYDSDGAQNTKDPHKYDTLVALENQLDQMIDELYKTKSEILAAINQLPDRRERMVLTSYYIDGNTWEQTAVDLNYSYMHVMRIHGYALSNIEPIIKML